MLQDLRQAFRLLAKAPAFTAVALLTLALGIGANTAIFTLVNATLLRQLPVGHPRQLVLLTDPDDNGTSYGTNDGPRGLLAYSEYQRLRDHNAVFTGLLAAQSDTTRSQLSWDENSPEPVKTKLVSPNYFSVLEVPAYRGRLFASTEGINIGADPVAVMTYAYWNQRFHRDPAAVGRSFRILGHAFTVIGIAPPGFAGENVGDAPALFIPLSMAPQVMPGLDMLHDPPGISRVMWLQVMGRMKPGVSLGQAQAAANVIFLQSVQQQAGQASDAQTQHSVLSQRLVLSGGGRGASSLRGQFADPLLALFALVALVLLLATVNLASLLLARATARQKEMGVRLALGAGRIRIVRQLLTESLLLAVMGGLLGLLLAQWGSRLLLGLVASADDPVSLSLAPDLRVLGFVAALCILTGVLFGLAPALRMARLDLNATLQAQGRGGSGRSRHILGGWIRGGLPLSKVLVIGQVALSIVLLVGAGLFVRSLQNVMDVPLGFQAGHLEEFGLDIGSTNFRGAAAATFWRHLESQIAAIPGVQGVALTQDGLFSGSEGGLPVAIEGYTAPKGQAGVGARFDSVSSGYFATTGIPILLGRGLTPQDEGAGPKNAVINQTMQRRFFAGRDPLGQQLRDLYPDDHNAIYTIVGVARDAKYNHLDETTPPRFYLSYYNGIGGDDAYGSAIVLVRAAGSPGALAGSLRQAIRDVDPNLPLPDFDPVSARVARSLLSQKMLAKLSGFFGVLALLLAAIGLYGVMAYGVARRTAEIGVRMALGAGRRAVIAMILTETAVLVAIGCLVGLPASLAGAKLVASQIHFFGLAFYDPRTLAEAVAVLAAVALAAGYLPALRASRVDPLTALRED